MLCVILWLQSFTLCAVYLFPVGPLIPDSSSSFTNHTFREGDAHTIYFVLKGKSSFQVVRVFNDGEPTTLKHSFEEEFESGKDRHVFTIDRVEAQHEGIIQLEVENRANIVAEYHHVHVLRESPTYTCTHALTYSYTHY